MKKTIQYILTVTFGLVFSVSILMGIIGCEGCALQGNLVVTFTGTPATYFNSLGTNQCSLSVFEAGANTDSADSIYETTFEVTDGTYAPAPIPLNAGSYDVYIWFDVDGTDGPSDGDMSISSLEEVIVAGDDTSVQLSIDTLYGEIQVPVTSGWAQVDMYVTLMIYDAVEGDFLDLEDAGIIDADDDRGYTWRPLTPSTSASTASFALDVTNLTETDCFLFAFVEQDSDGEPGTGDYYGFFGYDVDYVTMMSNASNVDLTALNSPYDFDLDQTF